MKKQIILITILFLGISSSSIADYGNKTIIYENKNKKTNTNKTYITDLSYKSIQTQLVIGRWILNIEQNDDKLETLKELENLATSNIVKNIELSQNRENELEIYLKKSNNILIKSSFIIWNIKQELLLLKEELDDCITEKKISDKNYYNALQTYSKKTMEEAILNSQKYGLCATTKRILFNADREVLERLEYYYLILSKKSSYLSNKEWLIIKHFDLIKNNIIEELNTKMVLENIEN